MNGQENEIMVLAKQAGLKVDGDYFSDDIYRAVLIRFAKLVRNDYSNKHAQLWLKRIDKAIKEEREACAKIVEETDVVQTTYCMTLHDEGAETLRNAAAEIRARGEA